MSISTVASTKFNFGGSGPTATSSVIDTSSAVMIEVTVLGYAPGDSCVITDNKNNEWTTLTERVGGNCTTQKHFAYCYGSGKNGSGHTFTATGSGAWATIFVRAYDSSLGYIINEGQSAGYTGGSATGISVGSMTPSTVEALLTSCCSHFASPGTINATSPNTLLDSHTYGGTVMGGAIGEIIQTGSPSAANPAFTWTSSVQMSGAGAYYIESATPPPAASGVRLSQLVIETASEPEPAVRLSQLVVEVASLQVTNIDADLDSTLGAATTTTEADVFVVGSASISLGAASLTADGTVNSNVDAALSVTLGAATLAGIGAIDVDGDLALTLGVATLTGRVGGFNALSVMP